MTLTKLKLRQRLAAPAIAALAILILSASAPGATPATLPAGGVLGAGTLGIEPAIAQISKSRDTTGDSGGGNVSRVGDRTGSLISGWAIPVMLALAGVFILGALARREVGAAIAVVLITICASFFLLTPDSAEAAIKQISQFILPVSEPPRKVVRSYRLVFDRRWRIQKIQDWRIPLPQGLELRAVSYWLACLSAVALIGTLPVAGFLAEIVPPSLRFGVVPFLGVAVLSRWEVDGRSPHRALAGLIGYRLHPRELSGLRRCSAVGDVVTPVERLSFTPDLTRGHYSSGKVKGPTRLLLRYPAEVEFAGNTLKLRPVPGAPPLQRGRMLTVGAGGRAIFPSDSATVRRQSGS